MPKDGGVGATAFRHEALFYAGEDEFLAGTLPFIREAVGAGEPILVAVSAARARALQEELNGDAARVMFTDMAEIGKNPACIIPVWQEFAQEHQGEGRALRGIGEPIWAGRSDAELAECHHHEFLINLAFAHVRSFWLLCPYDVAALAPDVVAEARRSHPYLSDGSVSRTSSVYAGVESAPTPFEGPLSAPTPPTRAFAFGREDLRSVRAFVSDFAEQAGMGKERRCDLVLAVSELATNTIIHSGGSGTVLAWRQNGAVMCEVRDGGRLQHPLVGRERPTPTQMSGRGLWLVNHLCDLVQIRTPPSGNVVRVHMGLSPG